MTQQEITNEEKDEKKKNKEKIQESRKRNK